MIFTEAISVPPIVENTYRGMPFISYYDHKPTKNDFYLTLIEEDDKVYMGYVSFKDGIWDSGFGQVLFWMDNY